MTDIAGVFHAVDVDDVAAIDVGAGCRRRDLRSVDGVRAWIVDMAPGSEWPHVDAHPQGEDVFVVSGELVEGALRFPAGTYVHFAAGSSHRPRTDHGVRLIGWNPERATGRPASGDPASTSQHRALFDFEIGFANGGGLAGHDFRLDIDGDAIDDAALAARVVEDLRLLMVATVAIRNKRIVAETHRRDR